jgi:hypothetical protein
MRRGEMMKKLFFTFTFLALNLYAYVDIDKAYKSSLVIYNQNTAFVDESFQIEIKKTDKKIVYKNPPKDIQLSSLNLITPKDISIYSKTYTNNTISNEKLFQEHLDKEVGIKILKTPKEFTQVKATLLYCQKDGCLVKKEKKVFSVKKSDIFFTDIDSLKYTKPYMEWEINSKIDLKASIKMQYLIKNIQFENNYILNITDQNSADIEGWVDIQNNSAKEFKDTTLSILDGDINIQKQNNIYPKTKLYRAMESTTSSDSIAEEQNFEGQYLYTIPFEIDIKNNQKKSFKFLKKQNIKIEKKHSAIMSSPIYLRNERTIKPSRYINIYPIDKILPKGTIRVYSKINDKNIFASSANINHTPKNKPIDIIIGKEFDITVSEYPIKREDSKSYYDIDVNYNISNNSNTDKLIQIKVPFNKHTNNSINTKEKYTFDKSSFVIFDIFVKAKQTKIYTVNYRIKRGI